MKTQQHASYAPVTFSPQGEGRWVPDGCAVIPLPSDLFAARARRFIAHCLMASIALSPVVANTAYAAIADVPLYLTSPVQPNIMFLLDDSGSMQWEGMPDDITFFTYLYPRPAGLYGGSDYSNYVPDFDAANPYNTLMRSPSNNKVYYNPAVTYTPWSNQDGTLRANAPIGCALHNPELSALGCRDLTVSQTVNMTGGDYWYGTSGWYQGNHTFIPAVYYRYNGGSIWNTTSYTQIQITSATPSYTGDGRASRTDCTAGTCTYAQEIQNFANWYSYYRSRILTARAGIGKAFSQQGTEMRVGFGAINKGSATIDGVSTDTLIRGVRSFSGADRTSFFNSLYSHPIPASGTPLRRALDSVGQYFSRTDNLGPWGATPGTSDATAHLECRQSYSILMTDGYWNTGSGPAATANATLNVDGTAGPGHTGTGGATFTYSAVSPFTDGHSDTLADVAMYYWKNDLRTDLSNSVPTSTINPAFWQHMSTFGVGLGVTGSVSPTGAFAAIGTGATITWPDPTTSNAAKLDDLLHASVNGRGGFFSTSDPQTFAAELSNVLNAIVDRTSSSSAVASNSTRLTSSTHLYQALFKSGDWSGQLKAFPLLADGSIGTEAWDAANVLPAHGLRNIKTWNGTVGTDFLGALGTLTAGEVDYLRGDAANEVANGGTFRNRTSKLGDIINADPHYVKDEDFGYNVLAGTEGSSYSVFVTSKSSRTAIVYAGANDGMLHAFRANDGVERFAYVPNSVWPNLPLLTSPSYTHKYFVDGSPTAWDAYWASSWKTVLVGSLGAGGKAVYALDISNPDTFSNSNVLWEFTHTDLGYAMGNVTLARFPDGNYWAVFGNGYASTNGKAVLFMVRVDSPSTVKMIQVDAGPGNGLSTPTLVDSDGDRIVDLVYAGDLKGNVWKFDVSGSGTATWKSAYLAGSTPKPLFIAKDGSGNPQPITSPLEVGLAPSGATGLMIYFGTGKYFETGDESTITVQSMYGIVDSGSAFTGTNHRTQLQQQTIVFESTASGNKDRVMSDNTVTYPSQEGWFIDLLTPPSTAKGERVISAPRLFGGKLLFQTIIPSVSPCDYGGASWLMSVNPATGGRLQLASFDINGDGLFNTNDQIDIGGGVMANVSGVDSGVGISGGFGVPISAGSAAYVPLGGTAGTLGATGISSGTLKSRASWRQIQ